MASLAPRWRDAHAASLASARALVGTLEPSTAERAIGAAELAPESVEERLAAAAGQRTVATQRESALAQLRHHLDELDGVLDEMHAAVARARADVAALPVAEATDRGTRGLGLSLADRASALAAPLRAYEAQLALQRSAAAALGAPIAPTAQEAQALLLAWECQPFLEPIESWASAASPGQERQPQAAGQAAAIAARGRP